MAGAAAPPAAFPERLDHYFTNVLHLTADDRHSLLNGGAVAKLIDVDPTKEVAVFGGIWIDAPPARYVAAINDIEHFESGGGFRVTKRISEPPRLADFLALTLPDDDVHDLRSCKLDDCELKLSAEAIARIRQEIDWTKDPKPALDRVMRETALEYVNAYRSGGNAKLAVYRDRRNPTFVANEFTQLIGEMRELSDYVPAMHQFLLRYPETPAVATTSFFYWQEAQFGLKPTIRINHVGIQSGPDGTVVASKQIYSSHYFWTALELRALVPDPARGPGFWFVTVNRSRSDGLSGFLGKVVRGKVREGVRAGMEAGLRGTREYLERH